jgi:serine protein kinase
MNLIEHVSQAQNLQVFRDLNWEGSFEEYLKIIEEDPRPVRNAFQRVYDMITSFGSTERSEYRERVVHYNFFDDPFDEGRDAIYGLDRTLMRIVDFFKAAAQSYGPERRVLLLHGPVGSSKSTIARLLKKGLEHYSRTEEGRLYTLMWRETDSEGNERWVTDAMHGEPLLLVPPEFREEFTSKLRGPYPVRLEGDLSPASRQYYREAMQRYDGDWVSVIRNEVRVRRLVMSEKDRIGIGTFQPKDEKNQDSTELTGDINYRKIAEYGSDSDPRAFNFDGELNIANRGIVEFIEILKLDVAFLYDLLTASQEHKIKSKKFAQTDIDEVILGHTNEPEYRRLQSNEFMEALRDRTIKIDVPYNTRLSDEIKIYERDFTNKGRKAGGVFIAPHTIEVAALWAVLTRLEPPTRANLTLLQKLKLYDGKSLPGFTEENVKELKAETKREGLEGISPRYVQDKISNAIVSTIEKSVNPFMVLNELEDGLRHHGLVTDEKLRERYRQLIQVAREEYEQIIKNEVQRAISADEEAIARLAANYIDNVKAYTQGERVRNRYTGQAEEPNERLMRSIEEKIEIPESRKDDFRREIMNYIGALAVEGKTFSYRTNERLHRALELKLFEDQKDTIRLTSLLSGVVDPDTQAKIDVVKARLIKDYGYDDASATDVLQYVASIFARGDTKG